MTRRAADDAQSRARREMAAMFLADARLPIGGHTASGGLEAAIAGGMPPEHIGAYLRVRLATVTRVEAGAAVLAARATAGEPTPAAEPLEAVDLAWAWAARNPVAGVRDAVVAQGRALKRLLTRLSPEGAALRWLEPVPSTMLARPLVVGAYAGELGLDARQVARVVGYDDVQSVTAAGLKLLPLDPADAAAWTIACAEPLVHLVECCSTVRTLADLPAHSLPHLEAWHADHAVSDRRLFRV